jgi:hypothetical protein
VPVTEVDTHCNGFWDYQWLTDELLDRRGEAVPARAGVCDAVTRPEAVAEVGMHLLGGGPASPPPSHVPRRVPAWVEAEPAAPDPSTGVAGAYGPIPIAGGVIVRFRNAYASDVKIAGTFNGWRPDENVVTHREEDGTWQKIVYLSPGSYEYRLVVDGDWETDPNNEARVSNEFGGFNSVIHV